jgi:hypothetical protein
VARFEGEAGQLRHQVEFGGPDVAVRGPGEFRLRTFAEMEVM